MSKHLFRLYSTASLNNTVLENGKMAAWQLHSYGGLEELQLSNKARVPILRQPDDVLVKVLAASVNPLDVMMLGGYGYVLLNAFRQAEARSCRSELEFPLTLGRDFCGIVEAKGNSVRSKLKVGDIVYGVIPPHAQGCHAHHVIATDSLLEKKPSTVSIIEASGLLYAGVTAWSALQVTGDLCLTTPKGKRVLVIGGSGGVGTVAIQLLKAWGSEVVATCSTDAVPLLQTLKADETVDYTIPDAMSKIKAAGKYDIILDAAGVTESEVPKYVACLRDWSFSKFITLRSPVLRNTDSHGLFGGMVRNAADLVLPNLTTGAVPKGSTLRWGFFLPIPAAIEEITDLVESRFIVPIVDKVYTFLELPQAFEKVKGGHLRGKVIASMDDNC